MFSLYDVYKDSQLFQYIADNKTVEIFNFSFCIKFDEELLKNFRNPSNNLYKFTVKELVESTCNKFFSNSTCYSSIDLNRSYLFNYHSCLVFNDKDFDSLIRKFNNTDFYIFAFANYLSEIFFFENIFRNVGKLKPFTLDLEYFEYRFSKSFYEKKSYQVYNKNLNFETKEIVSSYPSCVYECFKKTGSRSLNYYYSRSDNEQLVVYEDDLKILKSFGKWRNFDKNLTTDLENKCSNECKASVDLFLIFLVNEFTGTNQIEFNLNYNSYIYSKKPLMSKTQTIINLISLIFLFLNISIYETIPYLIKKILPIYLKKYQHLFNQYYWILKLIILILCLSAIICLSLFRIFEYLNYDYNRLVAFNFTTEISPFYLMICVPIQVLIDNHNRLDEAKENNLLMTKSFTELENITNFNVFESGLERIYIEYASIEKEADYSIDRTKIVFKYFDYEFENYTMSNFLLRCYKIDFNIRELRYEILYSLSKLKIILKFNWYIIYPLPENFNLTTRSINLIFDPYFYKRIHKKKSNCSDYSKSKLFWNLSDYETGVNQCINKDHLDKYYNLTVQSVIYKDTIPSKYKLDHVYFNQFIDQNISSKCKNTFKTINCFLQYFKINKRKSVNQVNEIFNMNLYYVEHLTIDNIIISLSDLLLNNLLSFESIFIGLNIGKILFILFILLKRYKLNRIVKYYNYFKFLIILIGLLFHLYCIIDDILNGEYILLTDYMTYKSIQLPNLIFCFEIQNYNEIDLNYKQTSKYLNDFSKNLNLNFFEYVSLLDNDYNEKLFFPNRSEKIQNFDKINTIYFLNLKCFEFVFKLIEFDNYRYSHILNDLNFISFEFNKEIISEYFKNSFNFTFYLITRKKSTNELNGIEKINFNYDNHPSIRVDQKLNILEIEEKFSFFHNPLSILYDSVNLDDTTEYINQLSDDLRKLNLRTKRIIVNSIDFDNQNEEIDDEMFDQYFYQIKNVTDLNALKILNYKREIYITKIIEKNCKNEKVYDLNFYFFTLCEKYTFTNRDNYSKFIISILNCLNIWLNFCCLDFYIYLQKLCNLIYKFYQNSLSFKFYLKQKKLQMLMQNL